MTAQPWLTGPIAITGGNGHAGRALQRRLTGLPNVVRVLGRDDDWEQGVRDAAAVVHQAGTLQPRRGNTYVGANVGTVERLLAATAEGTPRIVYLSYVGADGRATNAYLSAKGRAEDLISASTEQAVIIRSTFVCGTADDIGPSFANYQVASNRAATVIGNGAQRIAPIWVDDLAQILAAAALNPATPTGTFDVGGPTVITLDDLVAAINPGPVTIRHMAAPVARILARVHPQLTPELVEILLRDSLPAGDPDATARRFGVALTHLTEGPASSARAIA